MSFKKKLLITLITVALAVAVCMCSAFACTMIYVGSDLTDDGTTYLARSEDYSNSYNKVAYVSPAGENPAGYVYEGCYGFKHTFTHDSYAYTANRDDNLVGEGNTTGRCPNCGQTHKHTPMEEAGCNEKGVSVSAMVTLSWNGKYKQVDNMVSGGMCESDMTTILLGEAASAKEGVDLLLGIYDTVGAEERSGVLIADQKEAWYIENYTGHQYIAVKLSPSMIAISPNMGAIGLVDLDDTENVIASAEVIAKAKAAESFVGDEAANQIDFRASYSNASINARMINGLNYLLGENKFSSENTTSADFTVSNVKGGEIVAMWTPIQANRSITTKDMVDFYKVDGIGNTGNLEWHIFGIKSEGKMETSTVEWLGMENGQYTVAIPYFPVLTTDMYEGYKVGGLGRTTFVTEAPDDMYGAFPAKDRKGNEGFTVLPAGWDKGYYWSVDALSNYALSSACSAEDNAMVKSVIADMQDKCYAVADYMKSMVESMDIDAAKAFCTETSAGLAKEAHEMTLALYKHIVTGQHAYTDKVLAATCTSGGCTVHTCICGDNYADNETAPIPHNYVKGVCSECGDVAPAIDGTTAKAVTNDKTGKIKITWEKVDGAAKYELYCAAGEGGEYVKLLTTKGTYCNNVSALPGCEYFYKVVVIPASDEMSVSAASEPVSAICKCAQVKVSAENNVNGKIKLSWEKVDGAAKYVVYRAENKYGIYTKLYTTKGTTCNNVTVTPGKTYYYKVEAVSAAGAEYDSVSAIVKAACKSPAPVVKASVTKSGAPKLTWKAVDKAVMYAVYRSTAPDGNYTLVYNATGLSYTNTSAKSGVTYYYKVVAVMNNPKLNSGFSTAVSVNVK